MAAFDVIIKLFFKEIERERNFWDRIDYVGVLPCVCVAIYEIDTTT